MDGLSERNGSLNKPALGKWVWIGFFVVFFFCVLAAYSLTASGPTGTLTVYAPSGSQKVWHVPMNATPEQRRAPIEKSVSFALPEGQLTHSSTIGLRAIEFTFNKDDGAGTVYRCLARFEVVSNLPNAEFPYSVMQTVGDSNKRLTYEMASFHDLTQAPDIMAHVIEQEITSSTIVVGYDSDLSVN